MRNPIQVNIISDEVDQELFIDEERINDELMDQPLRFRKWANLENKAQKHLKAVQLKLEQAKAQAYIKIKASGAKVTIKDLEFQVTLDPEVLRLEEEVLEAEDLLASMKTATKAFYQRHEVLKDLCANLRKELI